MFFKTGKKLTDFSQTFNTVSGKAVLKDLAKLCNAYSSSFVSGDPMETARNEGKREVYNYIVRMLETNQELLHRQYHQDVSREQLEMVIEQEKELYG